MFDRGSDPLDEVELCDVVQGANHHAFCCQVNLPATRDHGSYHVPRGGAMREKTEPVEGHDAIDTTGPNIVDHIAPGHTTPR